MTTMLRTIPKTFSKKFLSVPPLRTSELKEVTVEVVDKSDDSVIGERIEYVPVNNILKDEDFCSSEPAEIYDIDNKLKVGLKPTFVPAGQFIKADIGTAFSMENQCEGILNDYESSKKTEESSSTADSSKTEE